MVKLKNCSLNLFLFGALITSTVIGQVPQGIPYQAVARDVQGQPLASCSVKVRFSVLDSTATGNAVYVETHTATTSALGLFAVNVGMGTSVTGTFSGINWGVNSKFLKVELDTTASGTNYVDLGTQQMMSVPYAMYAANSGNSIPGPQGPAGANGLSTYEIWLAQGNTGSQSDFLTQIAGTPLFIQNTIQFPGLSGNGTTPAQVLFSFTASYGERFSIQAKMSAWVATFTCYAGVGLWIENSSGTLMTIEGFDQFSYGVNNCNAVSGGEKVCLGYFAPPNSDTYIVKCNYSVGGYNNYQNGGGNNGSVQAMIYKL